LKNALAPVAALLIGVAILLAGSGLQSTLLPIRASMESFSTVAVGSIGAAYFFGFTLGCLRGPELVGNVGHVRVFAAMTALASAAPLIHGLAINPIMWGVLRFISGFCFAVLYVVIESWLNEQASNETRGIVFSTYVMITLTFLGVGQMMLVLYDPTDMHLFAIASVLVSMAAIPVVLSRGPEPKIPHSVDVDLKRLYRISPSGTVGCLVTGLANGSFWSLSPLFVAAFTENINVAATFMTAGVVGGALAQWPIGFLSDRLGRRKTMLLSTLGGSAIAAAIVLQPGQLTTSALLILGAAWGACSFPLYAVSVAQANDHADPEDYVMVSSGLLLMYGAGAIIGPFVASTVMTYAGGKGMFMFTFFAHLALAAFVAVRISKRRGVAEEHHVPFGDALATAHTASHVYEEEISQQAEIEEEPLPS